MLRGISQVVDPGSLALLTFSCTVSAGIAVVVWTMPRGKGVGGMPPMYWQIEQVKLDKHVQTSLLFNALSFFSFLFF